MYKCLHCGHEFEEIDRRHYDRGTGVWEEYCPNCGSEDFEECFKCAVCDENFVEEEMIGCHVCKDCLDKSVTFVNALRYGKERTESVEINGFLAWCFSPEQIESILLKNLQTESQDWRQRMTREFCTDDKYDFADFLSEKGAEE